MKCNNCGYEFDKPNLRSCPLCGEKIIPGVQMDEEKQEVEELPSIPSATSSVNDIAVEKIVEITGHQEIPATEVSNDPAPQFAVQEHSESAMQPQERESTSEQVNVAPAVKIVKPVNVFVAAEEEETERVIPEDPDEYVENGSYQPYPDEEAEGQAEYEENTYRKNAGKSSNLWIATAIAAVVGIMIGVLLYLAIG